MTLPFGLYIQVLMLTLCCDLPLLIYQMHLSRHTSLVALVGLNCWEQSPLLLPETLVAVVIQKMASHPAGGEGGMSNGSLKRQTSGKRGGKRGGASTTAKSSNRVKKKRKVGPHLFGVGFCNGH